MTHFVYSFLQLCCVLVVACSHIVVYAQPSTTTQARGLNPNKAITQYIHESWQNEQGLYQSYITALFQSRDGYLWLGTQEGLIRFDGIRFTTFDRSNTTFKNNHITAMAQDTDGTLWIGTNGGGLSFIKNGIFGTLTMKEGLPSEYISSLVVDKFGVLWVGTSNGLAYRKDGKFTAFTTKEGLTRDDVLSIAQEPTGALWVGTSGGGLNYIKGGRITGYVLDNNNLDSYSNGDPIAGADIRTLMVARDGVVWIGTSEGLNTLKSGGVVGQFSKQHGLASEDIRDIIQDREGTIWIATNGGGVNRYTPNPQGGISATFTALTTKNGLSADEASCLLEDYEGALWIGTDGGGITRLKDRRFSTFGTKQGLSNNSVLSVTEDNAGNMWFGTNAGLNRMDVHGAFTAFSLHNGLPNNIVNALLADRSGALWVGTRGGLAKMNLQNNAFTTYSTETGLSNDAVLAIAEAADSSIWVGTNSGLNRIKYGQIKQYHIADGLPNENIRALLVDRGGTLWLGTRGSGLSAFKDGKFTTYTIKDGLAGNYIWSLYEDMNGVLWVGTSGGLNRLKDGKFTSCTKRDGLFDDALFSITEDAAGWLWMSCSKGVFRVKKSEVEDVLNKTAKHVVSLSYGVTDGLRSLECASGSQPSVWRTKSGSLWYPTNRGASVVEPVTIPYNPLPPTVLVEKVFADSKRVGGIAAWAEEGEENTKPIESYLKADSISSINLSPGVDKFIFHYTATSLLMPERVKFRYMLEGYDKTWTDADNRRQAYYTNLPRGKQYKFRVIASNNDGVWNESGAAYSFYLEQFFWETWWFLMLCGFAVLAAGYGFVLYRLNAIRKRNILLKKMVDEQTAEISHQKEILEEQARDIELANTELQQKNILITASNDQLQKLLDNIESSIRYAKRIQDAMLPYHERISRALSEYFVLFKPRDIVSGDFYWFVEHGDKIVMAVADCTGHGVPGAFMSMIGNSLLSQIVIEQNVWEPDHILNNLHLGIQRALKQEEGDSRDGMDVAICVIDIRQRIVEYAGAMNPLYFIQNGELNEIKADRQPIGGQTKGKERIFTKHQIDFNTPTMLYIFSDGYQDQFGGDEGRKFMSRRFRELLVQIHTLPMSEQRKILDDTMEAWKGSSHRQIDDILVMGVRLK